MGRKKPTARQDENPTTQGGASKSKKKANIVDDDEYSIGTELSEEQLVSEEQVAPMKKGKRGNIKNALPKDEDEEENDGGEEDDEVSKIQFAGKKKSKPKKSGGNISFSTSAFGLLGDDDDENDNDRGGVSEEEAETRIVFEGKKKKSSKSKKPFVNDEDDDAILEKQSDNDEDLANAFSGKKKKSSKSSKKTVNSFSAAFDVEDEGEDVSASESNNGLDEDFAGSLTFSGKKKSSKKKNSIQSGLTDDKVDEVQAEVSTSSKVAEPSKNKKKKKKAARTAEEEDDLDKILAELGEAPAPAAAATQPTAPGPGPAQALAAAEPVEAEKEAEEEGVVESAAAKKKKKKKEKEKEKKAAAAAVVEEKPEATKGKVADKKVPKHVREMQEKLARQREAEERKKREEEEKLRKEEEERLRIEEEERIAEEKKRIKKEREKEKLLKKKLEGKLLTAKQKEEARRREAMRNQFLANGGSLPIETGAPTKKPKYQTKKSKAQPQGNGSASAKIEGTDSKEDDLEEQAQIEVSESVDVDEKSEVGDSIVEKVVEEEEEEEDDEEWDAKDWDDDDLKLPGISAFGDEETESEPEPSVKKESNNAKPVSKAAIPTEKVNHVPVKSQETDTKKSQVSEPAEKSKPKHVAGKKEEPKPAENGSDLRSPICCIMGHVDTGKTKLLDCIRGTNVQEGEAGGITQQIGATYFPAENIRDRTKELKSDAKLNVPGLLVIDTPGHESFTNLRSRGSGLCDIAILVVDIMHGLEPQTIESLNLLKMRNTEFIIALNKVDRLYGWKVCRNAPIVTALKQQTKDVMFEFNNRLSKIRTQFMEQGLNTELYYKNKEMGETFSIVPTSAISGEGIPDMLLLLVQWTQKTMTAKLTYSSEIQCTVLEVKVVEGHGTTIDVVLVNGTLHEGDQIVVCGMNGPIVASIRALLTPHPMKELRVKGTYLHHKEIKAAQGIKITAQGLEHAVAGTALYVVGPDDELEDVKDLAMEDMKSVTSRIDKSGEGVCVQASTLGSLEALLEFLKTPAVNIPVGAISIGPVHKKDVMKASVMLEKKKEYATILAFDVKVTQEASTLAEEVGVKIFMADIIYHLFDQFKAYIDTLKEEKKKETADEAVFPCVLKIMPNCVFNKKDPIVLGVDILEGIAKVGTPLCIPQQDFIDIGRIASIENNHKPVDYAKKGQQVAIKIIGRNSEEQQKMFGRHFDMEDELVSHITRGSIDILKANYRDDLSTDEWKLVVKLKKLLGIQ